MLQLQKTNDALKTYLKEMKKMRMYIVEAEKGSGVGEGDALKKAVKGK